MAQTIKLKRSSVSGNVPSAGQLELGELAINTFDGKVYIKKDNGTESVVQVGEAAELEPTSSVYVKFIYTATASQTTFSGSDNNSNTLSYTEGYTEVYLNGIKLVSGTDYTATNGTSIVLTSGASASDTLEVIAMGGTDVINLIVSRGFNSFLYTATASQTVFSGSDDNADTLAYTAGQLQVFLNGVLLDSSDYTATNGTSITLGAGAALNDKISVMAYSTNDLDHIGTLTIAGITYPSSDGSAGQVLVTDGSGNLVFDDASGGIALTDLSVSTNSAGTAALSYSSATGVFTYTPPDLSSYLTSVAFSDLTSTPTTIAGYGITDAFDGAFSSLSSTPTTIAGYGITDAFDGAFSSLSSTPTTIAGYGITDAFDGAYSSLTGAPTNVSSFTNDSGYLVDVVEDTTPQLGGNLDGQAFNITTTGDISSSTIQIGNHRKEGSLTSTIASTSATNVVMYTSASYVGAKLVVTVTDNVTGDTQITEALVLTVNGGTPKVTTYGTMYTSANALASFDAANVSTNTALEVTMASANNSTVKVAYTLIDV